MADITNYDPSQVITTIVAHTAVGFFDGDHIQVTKSEDDFTEHVGNTGEIVLARNRNGVIQVTLTFQQGSPSNAYLAALHEQHKATNVPPRGFGIRDLLGTEIVAMDQFWITKPPDTNYAKTGSARAWIIKGKGRQGF